MAVGSLLFAWGISALAQEEQMLDSLKEKLAREYDPAKRSALLLNLSDQLLTSNPDEALHYTQEALQICKLNKMTEGHIKALINLADIYQTKTELKQSIDMAVEARELALRNGFETYYASSLLIVSNCFRQLGEYKKSSDYSFEALEIYEKKQDEKGICDALAAIGIYYYEQNQNDKAFDYFTRSLEIARRLNYTRGISRGLNNIAVVYSGRKDFENSIEITKQSVPINTRAGMMQWLGVNFSNIAEDYLDLEMYDSAWLYLQKAIEVNKNINNSYNLAGTYISLSRYYHKQGNMPEYLAYTRMAMEIGLKNRFKSILLRALNNFQDYYRAEGEIDSAYKYLSLQYVYRDSLFAENSLNRLSQLELINKIENQEQALKMAQQRKDFIKLLIILILIGLIAVAVLLIVRYRIKVRYAMLKEQKLKGELEFKNKELAGNVMSLMKRNEMLTEITAKLSRLENETTKEETRRLIHKIALDIEHSTQENIWEEFEMRFKNVHSEFYEKLMSRFPDLTPNELRLCAFLRLNLNTKEISSLSGQSPRAVEMARFRLRRKLGISSLDVNLGSFISKI